jgi:rsbT co-antagonist protein RsbR
MAQPATNQLETILAQHGDKVLSEWIPQLIGGAKHRPDAVAEAELREQARQFLHALRSALQSGAGPDIHAAEWSGTRQILEQLSNGRAQRGFTPTETAVLVFSLKRTLFEYLRSNYKHDASLLADLMWSTTLLLDNLGLYTAEVSQQAREAVIARQQQELIELSTPVVELWENILALPVIGGLDSQRTQVVMESLLQKIVETGSEIAILDITGVPTVDTLTAQHLLKTVAAARLMGADCIISGIRPQIAQTMVHLGIDLSEVVTKASLADAFQVALQRTGALIARAPAKA